MPPNLARPCYVALGWALYMWMLSRNSIVHWDWGKTIGVCRLRCSRYTKRRSYLLLRVKASIPLSLRSTSHRIQQDSNPRPFDHEATVLPSELPCFGSLWICFRQNESFSKNLFPCILTIFVCQFNLINKINSKQIIIFKGLTI